MQLDSAAGDVIASINQQPVTTPQEAVAKLEESESGANQHLLLLLTRHAVNQYVAWSGQTSEG